MPKITIDRERCKGCLLCISFCPRGLIKLDNDLNCRGVKPVKFGISKYKTGPVRNNISTEAGKAKSLSAPTNNKECLGCMQCALICPDSCIEVYK